MAFNTAEGRAVYTASSAQTEFTFTFKVFTTADIKVYQTPVGTLPNDTTDLLTITTDYTVSINGDNGGTITLVSGATTGDIITLVRDLDIKRDVDYQDNGDLLASTLDSDQNYQTYLIQQNQSLTKRTIRIQDTTDASAELPSPQAGQLFRWNLAGDGIDTIDPNSLLGIPNATTVGTIASLRSLLYVGQSIIFVTGYYTAADNIGVREYYWDAASTEADNGGTIIQVTGVVTGRWKMKYSGAINVKWFGAKGDGVTDDTIAIQNSLGGVGTTKDNWSVYVPNGKYRTSAPLKVYRFGQILKNFSLIGESSEGVIFEELSPTKGMVIGEPSITDSLWGSATSINIENVQIKNISHKYSDIGMWVVFCRNIIIEDINGHDLVCLTVGNDGTDNCENVTIRNVTRMNNGRNMTPDAWYSIGIYQTNGFTIENYSSKFLPAAVGTGGSHITVHNSSRGIISKAIVHSDTSIAQLSSGNGITIGDNCTLVTVSDNNINHVNNGIVSYLSNNTLIASNTIDLCTNGLNIAGLNDKYIGNTITNSTNFDIYCANLDANNGQFLSNYYTTRSFPVGRLPFFTFIGNNINDDYEEGVFTPTLSFGGLSTGITYGVNAGSFTRVGNMVSGYAIIVLSSKGTASGVAEISGLPYVAGPNIGISSVIYKSNYATAFTTLCYVQGSLNKIVMGKDGSASIVFQNETDYLDNTRIDVSFTYFI